MVAVAVWPNDILGRQYLFPSQIEPFVFIFWQNMAYCSKKYPFSTAFELCFKEIFAKGKNRSSCLLQKQAAGEKCQTSGPGSSRGDELCKWPLYFQQVQNFLKLRSGPSAVHQSKQFRLHLRGLKCPAATTRKSKTQIGFSRGLTHWNLALPNYTKVRPRKKGLKFRNVHTQMEPHRQKDVELHLPHFDRWRFVGLVRVFTDVDYVAGGQQMKTWDLWQ
jgi:hypothetical protein